jgi:hypothetical protein
MERLITDPVRKVEFYMLQADKSINMAVFLAAKQNEVLAQEMLAKSQSYVEQAVTTAETMKQQGKEVPPYLIERFTNAGIKYKEVLMDLATRVSEAQKEGMMNVLGALEALQEKVAQLK